MLETLGYILLGLCGVILTAGIMLTRKRMRDEIDIVRNAKNQIRQENNKKRD